MQHVQRPYTKLTTGREVIITTRLGTFDFEVISLDEHGVTGYAMDEPGGKHKGFATLFPWPAIDMIAWKVE